MLHQRLKVNMELRNATTWNSELQLFKRRSITFQNPMKSNPIVHCSTVKCVEHVSNKSHWKIQKTDNKNPIKNPIPNHGKKHEQIQWTSWWDNKNTHQLTNPKKNGGKQKKTIDQNMESQINEPSPVITHAHRAARRSRHSWGALPSGVRWHKPLPRAIRYHCCKTQQKREHHE